MRFLLPNLACLARMPERHCVWALVLVFFALTGCGRHDDRLRIETHGEGKSLLVSEVLASADRSELVSCPLKVVNTDSKPHKFRLIRTGCTCYGVSLDGREIEKGEVVSVPADQTQTLQIRVQPAPNQSERHYTADLSVISSKGESQTVSVRCDLKVFSDLRLTPSILNLRVSPQESFTGTTSMMIEHVYRGEVPKPPSPVFHHLPDWMEVEKVVSEGAPVNFTADLWRQIWHVTFKFNLPAGNAKPDDTTRFQVAISDQQGKEPVSSNVSILVHSPLPVIYPNNVHFGNIPLGTTRRRRIQIASTEERMFRLSSPDSVLPDDLQIEFSELPDERHWVEISVTPFETGPFSELLTFYTDLDHAAEIEIHIEGIASAPTEKTTPAP